MEDVTKKVEPEVKGSSSFFNFIEENFSKKSEKKVSESKSNKDGNFKFPFVG